MADSQPAQSSKARLHLEIHGPAVTRDATQEAGERMVALLEEVARAQGATKPLGWKVADVIFKCDGCKRTQPFEASREGWAHRDGDDFCPDCEAKSA